MGRQLLPSIESYTAKEIESFSQQSPAVKKYINLIKNNPNPVGFSDQLRLRRHQCWLRAALATLKNQEHPEIICRDWSQSTIELLTEAWSFVGADKTKLSLFALGKLGAMELNLSSDVDLLFVCDHVATKAELKCVRNFIQLLSENTHLGFCFRVDTDLRPGGRLGPLISSTMQFEDYYWTQGLTWERVALVRMIPIVGSQEGLASISQIIESFSYRKFLDYRLFEDIKTLRGQIHDFYGTSDDSEGIHLKLVPGGIRDIELYTHVLQIIHGGRFKELRVKSTTDALKALKRQSIIDTKISHQLEAAYWELRKAENIVQSIDDQQTHTLNRKTTYPEITPETYSDIEGLTKTVNSIVAELLGSGEVASTPLPSSLEKQKEWLNQLGFRDSTIKNTWPRLLKLTARSSRSGDDEKARKNLLYHFVMEFNSTGFDKDLGLMLLADFMENARAKASFFTLFLREKKLIQDIAILFSASPYLGGVIASRPELVDSYLYRSQNLYSDDMDTLLEELSERKLLTEIIATNEFLATKNIDQLTNTLSITADEICQILLNKLIEEYGPSDIRIVCLGKWGGSELGLRSDLDFIFITPKSPSENDIKIARRFIARLTDQYKGGPIYSIDLRLRPSGNAGPLLVTMENLETFLKSEAESWQRQAYLKARPLFNITNPIQSILTNKPLSKSEIEELGKIRFELKKQNQRSEMDVKYSPGGLLDIEFAAQTTCLLHQIPVNSTNTHETIKQLADSIEAWHRHHSRLLESYRFLRLMEQTHQITSQASGSDINIKSDTFQRMSRFLSQSPEELELKLKEALSDSSKILKDLDPIHTSS